MSNPTVATCGDMDAFADRFFNAIEGADIDALKQAYDPNVKLWINITGKSEGLDTALQLMHLFTSKLKGLHYEVEAREFFADGFVQRHTVTGILASGEALAVPVCLVVHVVDGRITRLYEYLDAASIQPVFA